ncbi:MAG: hypothetical protein KGR26_11590, partial [Cyanobacteria bacterium REEB65]|nr:hypothetical protein [Cyanobacteria bacterium REEB65]
RALLVDAAGHLAFRLEPAKSGQVRFEPFDRHGQSTHVTLLVDVHHPSAAAGSYSVSLSGVSGTVVQGSFADAFGQSPWLAPEGLKGGLPHELGREHPDRAQSGSRHGRESPGD